MKVKRQSVVLTGIILLLIISLLVGACAKAPAPATPAPGAPAASPTPAPAPVEAIPIVFASGSLKTAETSYQMTDVWFLGELKRLTAGRLAIKEFWGGTLAATSRENFDLLRKGAIDITTIAPSVGLSDYFPWSTPYNGILGLVKTAQEQMRLDSVLDKEFPQLPKEWTDQGIKKFYAHGVGPYNLMTAKPIKTLADLKGGKYYAWSYYTGRPYEAVGAVPLAIGAAEMVDAMRTGMLAGMTKDISYLYGTKGWDIAPYYTYTWFGSMNSNPLVMNMTTYQSLPGDLKKIVDDLATQAVDKQIEIYETRLKMAYDTLPSRVTFINLSKEDTQKWQDLVGGIEVYGKPWLDDMEKKYKVPRAEALRFLNRIQELAVPGWKIENIHYPPDWVYKSPLTGATLPRIYPLTP